MVLDDETKQQLDNLANQNFYTDEQLTDLWATEDPVIQEKVTYYRNKVRMNNISNLDKFKSGLQNLSEKAKSISKVNLPLSQSSSEISQGFKDLSKLKGVGGNIGIYTGKSQTIRSGKVLVEPSNMRTQSFNSVLYDGVRKFNDGFHTRPLKERQLYTDERPGFNAIKSIPDRIQINPNFSIKEEGRVIPTSLQASKINFGVVNNRFNKTRWNQKWQQ